VSRLKDRRVGNGAGDCVVELVRNAKRVKLKQRRRTFGFHLVQIRFSARSGTWPLTSHLNLNSK
jgi:hypothetical protein